MKNVFLFILLIFSSTTFAQTPRQIENEHAFAKVYGYLKYFYPGDEAAKIDWGKFAIYGAKQVEGCKTEQELQDSLNALVKTLMPGVKVVKSTEKITFDTALLKPKNLEGYEVVAWQHLGVGLLQDQRSPYQSARTHRPTIFKSDYQGRGNAYTFTNADVVAGKKFELTGKARMAGGNGKGYFWFRVDLDHNKMGLLENMSDRPITNTGWQTFSIKGTIDSGAKGIVFGAMLANLGILEVDDVTIKVEGYEVFKADFEKEVAGQEPKSFHLSTDQSSIQGTKYSYVVKQENANQYLAIQSPVVNQKDQVLNQNLFAKHAAFGEYLEKLVSGNLKIVVPLALYGTKENTFPKVDSLVAQRLLATIFAIDNSMLRAENIYFRLGNIINTWNVFQHFYPYFEVAKTNWEANLNEAISKTYADTTDADFATTLKQLTAKLKDGHISVSYVKDTNFYAPPIAWKWLKKALVITAVLDEKSGLKRGEVVDKINGEDAGIYFKKVNEKISAATTGYLNHRAETESLYGPKNSIFNLGLANGKEIKLTRNLHLGAYFPLLPNQDTIKSLGDQITYISISNAKMKKINDSLPLLQNSKAIICDLRGYPADNIDLIQYLMVKNDNSKSWMQIPEIIYPDQEKIVDFKTEGWGLKPKSPHLSAKVFFLIDGQAISYAESYMSFIEYYKLATIIGQPTAGTNGNVNTIILPGGYSVRFTGMKVLKHDGSPHHGVGIKPNIYVEQSIKGIRENRDEILERAIAEASKE